MIIFKDFLQIFEKILVFRMKNAGFRRRGCKIQRKVENGKWKIKTRSCIRLLTEQTITISSAGRGLAPYTAPVTAAYPSMDARRFIKRELWMQKSVALD